MLPLQNDLQPAPLQLQPQSKQYDLSVLAFKKSAANIIIIQTEFKQLHLTRETQLFYILGCKIFYVLLQSRGTDNLYIIHQTNCKAGRLRYRKIL